MAVTKKEEKEQKRQAYRKVASEVIETPAEEYIENSYLPYAFSVCLDRALVFIQDGLKPIHRRILYTAYRNNITDKSALIKSATFTGRVMFYSPHGDCYSSVVNMAAPITPGQPRSLRVPLVQGKGNWGGLDTTPASSRYTEMRLWPAAMELIKELPEDAVDMVPNYNETDVEPKYLPARWPVAIINGTTGMAVGFACNLPCHNPDEVMDTCIDLVKDPTAKLKIKGPDFDCGCDIVSVIEKDGEMVDGIKSYLETGQGTFIMRGCYTVHESKSGTATINFTSLPYQVGPEKVLEVVKKQYEKGHLKELASWKDLSDIKTPVNVEFKTKKGVNVDKVINDLFSLTPLQDYFSVNATVVKDNLPQKIGMREMILAFIDFRRICTRRKLNFRVKKAEEKLHIQEALQAVLLDIDKCISIIRKSDTADIAREQLMKAFKIDEEQANYILSIQLRRLTKSDKIEIEANIEELKKKIAEIKGILSDEKKFDNFVVSELEDTKKVISSARKCKIVKNDESEMDIKDVYLKYKNGKVKRTFKAEGRIFPVDKEGRVMIVTYKNGIDVRSIYELPDEKYVPMSSFSNISGRAIAVAGTEGYLVLVGINGMMKIVKLDDIDLPKGQSIKKVLGQPVAGAFVVPEIKGKVLLNDKKEINLKKLPVFGISANGNKVWPHSISSVKYVKPE